MNEMNDLQEQKKLLQLKVSALRAELRAAQTDMVGIDEAIRDCRENNRIELSQKVVPVYGHREEQIDHMRRLLPDILETV